MEFSKEIINVLDYLCGKFGIVIDWTSDNIMPYLKDLCGRYIQYEVNTSIAWCIVFAAIIVIVGLIWGIAAVFKKSNTSEIFSFIFFIALAIGIIVCACQVFDIIECRTIPEKIILEYLKQLKNVASNR